jgi:hypothetical protein
MTQLLSAYVAFHPDLTFRTIANTGSGIADFMTNNMANGSIGRLAPSITPRTIFRPMGKTTGGSPIT